MDTKIHPFHEFPPEGIHLHHKTKPPIVAHDSETRDKAMQDGYTTEYLHKDFPAVKHVEVHNAAEADDAAAHGFHGSGDFPRTVSRTFQSEEEFEGFKNPKEPESSKDERPNEGSGSVSHPASDHPEHDDQK